MLAAFVFLMPLTLTDWSPADPDGYELCIVSSETFDKAVSNPPWVGPTELKDGEVGSWSWRRSTIDAKAKKKDKGKSS